MRSSSLVVVRQLRIVMFLYSGRATILESLLFDAFSFVQGALVFFVIAAIGLSMVSLAPRVQPSRPEGAVAA